MEQAVYGGYLLCPLYPLLILYIRVNEEYQGRLEDGGSLGER